MIALSRIPLVQRSSVLLLLALLSMAVTPVAMADDAASRLDVTIGRSVVVALPDEVRTVSIADSKVADAAVGSSRTVVVNGKEPGHTSLVVYTEGGRYRVYDVVVNQPNSERQVVLEVRVAEATKQGLTNLGFDWWGQGIVGNPEHTLSGGLMPAKVTTVAPFGHPDFIPGASPAADGFFSVLKNTGEWKLASVWQALEQKGDLRTLAHPNLVARSGEKAHFVAGGELGIPVVQGTGSGSTAFTIEWKEYGVRVDFVPTVWEDETIELKASPEVSAIDATTRYVIAGYAIPSLTTRKASTTVLMKDGQSLVIGGLTQKDKVKTVRRIPILGYLPILGTFFGHQTTETVDRDLVIVVTPHLLGTIGTQVPPLPGQP